MGDVSKVLFVTRSVSHWYKQEVLEKLQTTKDQYENTTPQHYIITKDSIDFIEEFLDVVITAHKEDFLFPINSIQDNLKANSNFSFTEFTWEGGIFETFNIYLKSGKVLKGCKLDVEKYQISTYDSEELKLLKKIF